MDLLRTLVALAYVVSAPAIAGYAQLKPPPGWTAGTGAGATYQAAANEQWLSSTVRTNAALNVGGRTVQVPAAMRLSANAPRMLAGRVGTALAGGLGSPLAIGLTVAAALVLPEVAEWIAETPYRWDSDRGKFVKMHPQAVDTYTFDGAKQTYLSEQAACSGLAVVSSQGTESFTGAYIKVAGQGQCRATYRNTAVNPPIVRPDEILGNIRVVPGDPTLTPVPVPFEEVRPALENAPLPAKLPNVIWPVSWPVDDPLINPSPAGQPQPMFVPTGNPLPNPNYQPSQPVGPGNQPHYQPGVRMVPTPVPGNPWNVDLQPVDRPVDSPDPDPEPKPDPDPNPDDKPNEDKPDLCETHPEIVACQKLGDVQPEALAKNTVTMSITKQDGFGPESGQCPAPKEFVVMGKSMAFRWDLLCDFATGIRPLLIGFAWLSAALAFIGLSRKDS